MLKYETPSWFYGRKRLDYGISDVNVCPQTSPEVMLQWPFCYNDSPMYAVVLDISCIAESVVPEVSERLDGEGIGLKISGFTITQFADDVFA